ncbi:Voltage-dependent anion-selective channel protein 1 [Ranunculus cassubicifolius]
MFERFLSKFWKKEEPKPVPPPRFLCHYDKEIQEIYYKGFEEKFSITTASSLQVLTLGAERRDRFFTGLKLQSNDQIATSLLGVDSASKLHYSLIIDSVPLKAMVNFGPLERFIKFGAEYTCASASIRSLVSWASTRSVDISGAMVVRSHQYSIGGDISYCFTSGRLIKLDIGALYSGERAIASLTISEGGDLLKSSVYHLSSSVGAAVYYRLSSEETDVMIGFQHRWSDSTAATARLHLRGDFRIVVRHEVSSRTVSVSGAADLKAIRATTRLGLSLALRL